MRAFFLFCSAWVGTLAHTQVPIVNGVSVGIIQADATIHPRYHAKLFIVLMVLSAMISLFCKGVS